MDYYTSENEKPRKLKNVLKESNRHNRYISSLYAAVEDYLDRRITKHPSEEMFIDRDFDAAAKAVKNDMAPPELLRMVFRKRIKDTDPPRFQKAYERLCWSAMAHKNADKSVHSAALNECSMQVERKLMHCEKCDGEILLLLYMKYKYDGYVSKAIGKHHNIPVEVLSEIVSSFEVPTSNYPLEHNKYWERICKNPQLRHCEMPMDKWLDLAGKGFFCKNEGNVPPEIAQDEKFIQALSSVCETRKAETVPVSPPTETVPVSPPTETVEVDKKQRSLDQAFAGPLNLEMMKPLSKGQMDRLWRAFSSLNEKDKIAAIRVPNPQPAIVLLAYTDVNYNVHNAAIEEMKNDPYLELCVGRHWQRHSDAHDE